MSCCEELEERLKRLQKENAELKRQRTEDAKSNEKVASMFSTQEQNWIAEKKSLRLQIQALFSQFRVIEAQKEEKISCLMKTVEEKESEIQVKNREVEEVLEKNNLLEHKLRNTEQAVDELNQKIGKESDEHSGEVLRLMSKQKQLETDMQQALQQVEFMKRELDEALQRKNDAVEVAKKASEDVAGVRKDKDKKQQILSAILRVSKHDNTERKLLLKEMKMSKMRRKQAELESGQWTAEPWRRRKGSSRLLELSGLGEEFQLNKQEGSSVPIDESIKRRPRVELDELIMIDIKHLQEWIESETKKCTAVLEQRHCKEINAFAEQMRLNDEKMESFRLKLLRSEVEHKCLKTRIYDLEQIISRIKAEKFNFQTNSNNWHDSDFLDPQTLWSDMKINPCEEAQNVEGGDTMKDTMAGDVAPEEEEREEKEVCVDPGNLPKTLPWKVDINAMGVSYKIKRLKQQFLVIEKLTSSGEAGLSKSYKIKGFYLLLSLMNKQVQRYQTLEEKTDDLCKRMNENELVGQCRDEASDERTSEQVEALEMFLEETFKLQRYMVATGQKLMAIHSMIACSFISNANDSTRVDKLAGFNMAQFSNIVGCLLKEIQRGMEVRITQVIADLEGILARDVITRF